MILRRLFTLAALAVAASLSLSDRANAAYDVSTSIQSVTGSPPITGLSLNNGPGSFVIPGANGGTVSVTTGFTSFVDGGGSTIYLVNSSFTSFTGSLFTANEYVYAAGPSVSTDTASFTFTAIVKVTNPSLSANTGTFTMTETYNISGGSGTAPALPTLSTASISVGGVSFAIFNPQVQSLTVNSISNFGGISAQITSVPEPASVVMMGVGLVGVAGLGLRRMKRKV